jgi:chemotaxis protein methyltransferase CheR
VSADATRVHELLDRLLGPRLGHRPQSWPRRLHDLVERLAQAERRRPTDLLAELLSSGDELVLGALLDAATIGHTQFFRHPEQFAEVERVLVREAGRRRRTLKIWCAGCSTGEEAYSLALTAERAGVPYRILATDVNPVAVELARVGSYSARRPGQLPESPGALDSLTWSPPESLRSAIRFEVASLTDPNPTLDFGPVDLVFCRNVLIYFDRQDVPALLEFLAAALLPGGALIVSPADAVLPVPSGLERGDSPGWFRVAANSAPVGPAGVRAGSLAPIAPHPRAPSSLPPSDRAISIERAARLLGSGRGPEAEAVLTQVLDAQPDSGPGWFLLGEALVLRGEVAQARAAFVRASRSTAGDANDIDLEALRWAAARRAQAL